MRCWTATAWCTPAAPARHAADGHRAVAARPQPNALWCADYKGEFMLGNRRYCYPLTITDFASRYLLDVRGARRPRRSATPSRSSSATFQEFGLPQRDPHRQRRALRVGARALRPEQAGGVVAAPRAFGIERIKPGHPEQNGRHERMHLTLKTGSHQARRARTSCSSRRASTPSSTQIQPASGRTRRSA